MSYLITYLDNRGALRSAISYSSDKPYQVRLHFLQDFPKAAEILYFGRVEH